MSTIEEKRVFGDRGGATAAYVASAAGLLRVRVAADVVGEFGLLDRRAARDVAATGDRLAVATDDDVLVASFDGGGDGAEPDDAETGGAESVDADAVDADADRADEPTLAETGFGPAVAVGVHEGDAIAASPDGRVARRLDGEWRTLEDGTDLSARAVDGDLVAAAEGVYRVHDGGLDHAGLADVRDVSKAGVPLAATDDGLYTLGNGWMERREGSFEVAAAERGSDPGRLERAHAVSGLAVYAHDDGAWVEYARTSAPVADVAYGETVYAVTARGSFLARRLEGDADAASEVDSGAVDGGGDDGWRARTLGVPDVSAVAIPGRGSGDG